MNKKECLDGYRALLSAITCDGSLVDDLVEEAGEAFDQGGPSLFLSNVKWEIDNFRILFAKTKEKT